MAQKIGIDTVILIYLLEENPAYISQVEKIFNSIQAGIFEAVFSSVGLIELFTGVKRKNRYDLVFYYRTLLADFPHLTIMGINEQIIDIASDLRAGYSITTPDAIHLATAVDFGAKKFITNDKSLRQVKEIVVEVL